MTPNTSASFLERQKETSRKAESLALANFVGRRLIPASTTLFIVSGTTGLEIADVVMREVRAAHIITNSVPVAWRFMELEEEGKCAPHAQLTIVGGVVRAVTGAISGHFNTDPAAILVCAPHGLTEKAIMGNRDVEDIKKLLDHHRRIIMPVSWRKLGRGGNHLIKHYGHWKQVECHLVLTKEPHPELEMTTDQKAAAEKVIRAMQAALGDRLKIHEVPMDDVGEPLA